MPSSTRHKVPPLSLSLRAIPFAVLAVFGWPASAAAQDFPPDATPMPAARPANAEDPRAIRTAASNVPKTGSEAQDDAPRAVDGPAPRTQPAPAANRRTADGSTAPGTSTPDVATRDESRPGVPAPAAPRPTEEPARAPAQDDSTRDDSTRDDSTRDDSTRDDSTAESGAALDASQEQAPEAVGPPELVPAGDPSSADFIGPPLVPPFTILATEVLPGSSARLEWKASQSFAGSEVISPVTVVHGTRPGPVLCLTAAIHGDELNGVEIVRRVVNQLDPADLAGTVIGVPIVNLFGFSRNSRYLPDRRDLNRFFPGSRYGSIASRIANSFFDAVVGSCSAVVDFHTGSFDRSNLPQVRADLRIAEVLEFTRGFGATPVLHSDGSRGMLRVAATERGIPAVTFEVGAPARLQPEEIGYGVQAIDALMHRLGMTRDKPEWNEPQPIFYDSAWVRADAGGMLMTDVALGDRVVRGQRLGRVIDPINNIEREITSPVTGRVIGMALNQVVLPGFAAYHVGVETSEARAVEEAASGQAEQAVEEDPEPGSMRESDPDSLPPEDGDYEED